MDGTSVSSSMLHRVLLERLLSTTGLIAFFVCSLTQCPSFVAPVESFKSFASCPAFCVCSQAAAIFHILALCFASHMLPFFENWVSTTGYQFLAPSLVHNLRCICAHTKVCTFSRRSASSIVPHCSVLSFCSSLIAFEIGVIVTQPG